jgi:DNA replication protein DnaC
MPAKTQISASVVSASKQDAIYARLDQALQSLKLPTFVRNHAPFADDALRQQLTYQKYLLDLADQEVVQRERNRHAQRIRAARFPVLKEIADFDFSAVPSLQKQFLLELARGNYIAKAEPILMIGNPGLGKTHAAIGLALTACRQSHRVRFFNAATLVNELIAAQDKHQVERFINNALRHQLIVLDEFGFIPFSPTGANLLFQFCSSLHERVALIVTTNLKFADWTQILGNQTLTAALLDRLTHRAHLIEFSGTDSYRYKQRAKRASAAQEVS